MASGRTTAVGSTSTGLAIPPKIASERLQVLNQVLLLLWGEPQPAMAIIVIYDSLVGRESTVVVETALCPHKETGERGGPIPFVGRAAGLEIVDPELLGGVHGPPGL